MALVAGGHVIWRRRQVTRLLLPPLFLLLLAFFALFRFLGSVRLIVSGRLVALARLLVVHYFLDLKVALFHDLFLWAQVCSAALLWGCSGRCWSLDHAR